MALPPTDRASLEEALRQFDIRHRTSPEWVDWEKNAAQRYALYHNGRAYPPKKIISLATGMPVSEFSGGRQSNEYLQQHGFDVATIDRNYNGPLEAPSFTIGRIYKRSTDIHEKYGGSYQSGISASGRTAAIFLFTGKSGEQYGYRNDFDADGVFSYTGEGQVGDMELQKGNLSIATHAAQGRALHVFQSLGKGKGHRYIGEFTYVSHAFRRGLDREGNDRRIIVFHLVPVGTEMDDSFLDEGEQRPAIHSSMTLAEARERAMAAFRTTEGEGGQQTKRMLYNRSKAVKDYVLLRAAGMCESCHEPAPFTRVDGTPYLEPHHTTRVSDGGLDHPRFVGAVCPTCHREIHYGNDGKRRNAELTEQLAQIEPLN